MNTKQTLLAPLLCDLTDQLGERHFVNLRIGARREVLMLSTEKKHKRKGFRFKGTPQFRIHHWSGGELREIDLPPSPWTFYFVAAVGENYLCVTARCAPGEHNAQLFDAQGVLLNSWHAGDGIEDVQATSNGQIWVSYFDEGVFAEGENSPGAQGLTCFDARGQRIFGFLDDVVNNSPSVDSICDCYSLNVASNRDTWLCYYESFSLVHLRDLKLKALFEPTPEMVGISAFAVCDWRHLFVGGYHNKSQIFWRDEASKRQVEFEATDETGESIEWSRAYGRGADLFLCNDARVRMLSLQEIGF